jgi:uncharacterized protein YggE
VASGLRAVIVTVQATPGVGPGDVSTGRVSIGKVSRAKGTVYRASEGISVTLHQPDAAGDLITAAIRAGATGTRGPNFFVGDSELAYKTALAAAFDKAKGQAAALAAEAGAVLGPALNIEEGGGVESAPGGTAKESPSPCVTPTLTKRALDRCSGATPPVKPGTSTVTATVHVVFELQ